MCVCVCMTNYLMESTKRICLSRRYHKRCYLYLFIDIHTCLTKSHQAIGHQINYSHLLNRIHCGFSIEFDILVNLIGVGNRMNGFC